ncbi:glycerol-3-phosphate 1-O-acyltransferase PlsY [Psychrobacillus sp. OK032]|uniref:glycerol-3-phosphate 1-O-acyltransferase PlsY n=1 Tax=Psychrobacillus sp. OK032 TaxID=1884358 RepID=UPI0008BECB1C|nr:glycerol-3-phosphate 1-O-acyltransferase PlsY [Psychrobacillus sp. OK032]SES11442.1 glycerol-3-phosphate acyltransferase PlsY [Psychrobacillus sp. OK032]
MTIIILLLLAYVIGSIPSGLWVGKIFYNTDIREHGSGNLGGTNTFRTLGKKAGLVVTIMDILKGTAATLLGYISVFNTVNVHPLILGIIAVIGHMFPIFAKFKGGKAVATSGGILLAYNWPLFVLLVVGFFIILKMTKMVSLTSMILSIIALIYSIIYYFTVEKDWPLIAMLILIAAFIFYRHRSNIKRIKNGTEPKVKWI